MRRDVKLDMTALEHEQRRRRQLNESRAERHRCPKACHPWRGKPGEIEILDAQGHAWVTLHAGANGDPIKWRNTITTAVFTALGIDPREIAK